MNYRTFEEYLEVNLEDPQEAEAFLKAAIEEYNEDGDTTAFFQSLHILAKSKGGITQLAKKSSLTRQNLYRIFNNNVNPQFNTIGMILDALGFKLTIEPKKATS